VALTLISKHPPKAGKTPLLVEVPVEAGLAPFLVSSVRDVMWIARTHQGHVRSAVQTTPLSELMQRFIEAIRDRGQSDDWGNVHPLTLDGLHRGVAHLAEYGFPDVDCFAAFGALAPSAPGLSATEVAWVPSGHAVLLPRDREFVGVTLDFGNGHHTTVIHNASRGVVVLTPVA
jgi:hypothetical protein